MKSKKLTYFLAALVLVVWGVIIYRIFDSAGNSDDGNFHPMERKVSKEPYNDYDLSKDTTHLLLNYKDPFSLTKQKDTAAIDVKKNMAKVIPLFTKPVANWSFIKYSGYIRNPGSKNLIALVNINGKAVSMSEGETTDQVRLIKNLQDSIKVAFNGKTTYIKIRSGDL